MKLRTTALARIALATLKNSPLTKAHPSARRLTRTTENMRIAEKPQHIDLIDLLIGRDRQMGYENGSHVEANVEVIREYLISEFKGFEVTEKKDVSLSYMFTVTKSADERYQLKIFWAQLADKSNTPERTKKRLVTDDVAGRMKGKSQGEYFLWGKH